MDVLVREVGNSTVVTLPKEIIQSLRIKKGDLLTVNHTDKEITLTPKNKKLRGEKFVEEYFKKPFEEIKSWEVEDVDTGFSVGDEAW